MYGTRVYVGVECVHSGGGEPKRGGAMIIDMRCRITTAQAAEYFQAQARNLGVWEQVPALQSGREEDFFAEIARAGVTTAVSVSGNNPGMRLGTRELPPRRTSNDYLADVQRRYWGRFIGVAGIDVSGTFHDPLQEIERCHRLGLRAIFIEPGRAPYYMYLNDPRLYPIYEKCVAMDMALIPQTSGPLGSKNIDYANPKYLEQVAEDFPNLRIICGHGHYPFVREAITMATRRENVYLSPDIYLRYLGTEDWVKAVNEDIFGFSNKFLFGSAYPLVNIMDYVRFFFSLPWKKEVLPKILYKNALRALNLENDPVFREMYKLDLPDAEVDPLPTFLKVRRDE